MKKYPSFISVIVVVAMASVSCAQVSDKKEANLSVAAGPELRWKYEAGG